MRFERVLLISPPSDSELGASRPSAGLGYLSETLSKTDIEHQVLDMRLRGSRRGLRKSIQSFQPDLIGFSLFSHGYKKAYELAKQVRALRPNAAIAVGGPHVSTFREQVLEELPEVDYGVVLEGERTIVDLCRGKDESIIPGLLFRNESIAYNGDPPFITELDEVPFPRYRKFDLKRYIPERFIISSRGCPYKCIYCPVSTAIGRTFRYRSAENVVDEIEYWYAQGYRQFNFVDDNFTLIKTRAYEVCDEIERRGLRGLLLRCSNGVRADKVDRPLLQRMKEVGFHSLAFGVEAGNDKVLTTLKKGEKIADIEAAIQAACDLGYDVALFFVIGSPGETAEDIADSVAIARKYPILRANFYNLLPYPKTELFDWAVKNHALLSQPEEYLNNISTYNNEPLLVTPELPRERRVRILKELRKVEKEITAAAATRKLRKLLPFGAEFLGKLFATRPAQRMLFRFNWFRSPIEKLRYKVSVTERKMSNRERPSSPEAAAPRVSVVPRPTSGRSLKVLFVLPSLNVSGAGTDVLNLSRALKQRGHEPVVLLNNGEYSDKAQRLACQLVGVDRALGDALRDAGVRSITAPIMGKSLLHFPEGVRQLREIIRDEQPDIVNPQSVMTTMLSFAALRVFRSRAASRTLQGIPLVTTVHNIHSKRNYKFAGRIFNHATDFVIFESRYELDRLTANGLDPQRAEIIHNGIDLSRFQSGMVADDVRTEFRLAAGEPVVGCVARLSDEKGHQYLLEAMAKVTQRVPTAKLLLVGDGPLRGELETLAQRLGLSDVVRFAGSRQDVPDLLSVMDVFALASLRESFPLALREAMAMSRPVVATDVGGVSLIVEPGTNGLLVPSQDPGPLADALVSLLTDRAKAREMGRRARERIEMTFGIKAWADKTEARFLSLLARRGNEDDTSGWMPDVTAAG